jgi:hypothetical protein
MPCDYSTTECSPRRISTLICNIQLRQLICLRSRLILLKKVYYVSSGGKCKWFLQSGRCSLLSFDGIELDRSSVDSDHLCLDSTDRLTHEKELWSLPVAPTSAACVPVLIITRRDEFDSPESTYEALPLAT